MWPGRNEITVSFPIPVPDVRPTEPALTLVVSYQFIRSQDPSTEFKIWEA